MAAFLVTGGGGFIGCNLVEALVKRGDKVRVYDNFSAGQRSNLAHVQDQIEIIAEDLSNRDALIKAARGVDCVFHFAAPPMGAYDDLERIAGDWTHSSDTFYVLDAARVAGVRRVIYASSGSMYAHMNALQIKDTDPLVPMSPYAFTKLAGEHQCMAFGSVYGLETVRLRYFNVFGPRQCPSSPYAAAIPIILKAILAGQSPVIVDNVYEYQDFLYVDDAVHAALLAAEEARAAGKAYNIARGRSVNLLGIVTAVNELLNSNIRPVCSSAGADDYQPRVVSIAKAEAELGFCPRTDLKQGLLALSEFYAKQTKQIHTDAPAKRAAEGGPHFLSTSRSPRRLTGEATDPGT